MKAKDLKARAAEECNLNKNPLKNFSDCRSIHHHIHILMHGSDIKWKPNKIYSYKIKCSGSLENHWNPSKDTKGL